MLGSHANTTNAMSTFSVLMETFILLFFTISVIVELTIDPALATTGVVNISSILESSYSQACLLRARVLLRLRSNYIWAQVSLQACLPSPQRYEDILNWLQKTRQMIRAMSSDGRTRTEILFTDVALYMLQVISSLGTHINGLVISACLRTLEKADRELPR